MLKAGSDQRAAPDAANKAALKRCVAAADLLVGKSEFNFFMLDAFEGRRLYSNAAFDRMVGYDGREVLGRLPPYPHSVNPERALVQLGSALDQTLADRGVRAVAARYRHASGREFDVLITAIEARRAERLIAYLGMAIEIDELPHESALRLIMVSETLRVVGQAMDSIGRASLAVNKYSASHLGPLPLLTAREEEIAKMIAGGLRPASVAKKLALSPFTVRNHLKRIYKKLGVRSHAELLERLEAASSSVSRDD